MFAAEHKEDTGKMQHSESTITFTINEWQESLY